MNIVLDMDQTMIDGVYVEDRITARPFLKDFLKFCFDNFDNVSIWTAASRGWYEYVNERVLIPLLKEIGNGVHFDFVWCGDRVTIAWTYSEWHGHTVQTKQKKLWKIYRRKRKIGGNPYNKNNTIIVDDDKKGYQKNYGNGIAVIPWYADECKSEKDDELMKLTKYFQHVLFPHFEKFGTIRNLEKRFWRSEIIHPQTLEQDKI
jgi:hypothetical protein